MLRRSLVPAIALAAASLIAVPCLGRDPAPPDADLEARRAARRSPVVEVFEAARDAVVNISAREIITVRSRSPFDSFFEDFFDMPRPRERQYERESVGSGFVIHRDGYIVTNAHVVARTAELRAIFADGRAFEAQIVASDPQRDLAVLKIASADPLATLPLGRSDDLMIGETVIAIGNPLGYQHTVTAGVVSAIDRDLAISRQLTFEGLIQTDASINPGNSGGPLLNVLGELIGVNSAIRGDAQNIGFAIPVDQLREVLPELLDVERRYRLISGLRIDSVNEPRVVEVAPGSPAARAGVRVGDVLAAIDDRRVREGIEYDITLIDRAPEETLALTLLRDGTPVEARVVLEARPAPDGEALAQAKLGIEVFPLPEDIATELGLRSSSGLLVTDIEPGSPADEAGLQRRDILLAIDRHYIASPADLGRLLELKDAGEVVTVRVLRVDRRGKVQRAGPLRVR